MVYRVFIRPEVLDADQRAHFESEILADAEDCGMEFELEETLETLESLYEKIRAESGPPACFFLIDAASVEKGAIRVYETQFYDNETEQMTKPPASEGRNFLMVPRQAPWVGCNLDIGNMDWEDWAENLPEDGIFKGFD